MNKKYISIIAIVIIACASVIGYLAYSGAFSANPPTAPVELRVFMAASLINVLNNMTEEFNKENNCNIIINSGGSNTLYQQITSGSPCDVFMAADFKWTKQLNDEGLLYNNEYENFTTNKLEILLPKNNPQNINSLLDLIKPGVKIVMADFAVPVGSYTNTTLTKIDATWGNPNSPLYQGAEWENYREKFLANVVSYEAAVSDVVGKVALSPDTGIADAGVAYVSDAVNGEMTGGYEFLYVEIPDEVNTVGTYGIAVIETTEHADLAQKFMDFWSSTKGQNILQTFGFGT